MTEPEPRPAAGASDETGAAHPTGPDAAPGAVSAAASDGPDAVRPDEATPGGPDAEQPPLPDPMKGIRGVFAATLVLEAIVVGLALLVLPKFDESASGAGMAVVGALAVLMLLACGVQQRPWGLGVALGLQVAFVAAGIAFSASVLVMAAVFALVWGLLLFLRREVAVRMARGELPAQQARPS